MVLLLSFFIVTNKALSVDDCTADAAEVIDEGLQGHDVVEHLLGLLIIVFEPSLFEDEPPLDVVEQVDAYGKNVNVEELFHCFTVCIVVICCFHVCSVFCFSLDVSLIVFLVLP